MVSVDGAALRRGGIAGIRGVGRGRERHHGPLSRLRVRDPAGGGRHVRLAGHARSDHVRGQPDADEPDLRVPHGERLRRRQLGRQPIGRGPGRERAAGRTRAGARVRQPARRVQADRTDHRGRPAPLRREPGGAAPVHILAGDLAVPSVTVR